MRTITTAMSATLVLILLGACGRGPGGDPDEVVADPRAYAIEALRTMDLHTWWQAYRDTDPGLLGGIVDEVAARQPGGLPTARGKLDLFIRNRIASKYKLRMDDTEEGKAFILARAEERFADPPTALWKPKSGQALLDFHILPGVWKSISRISEGLTNPPAVGRYPHLKPEVLARALARLVAAHPEASTFQIRYRFHLGSDQKNVLLQIQPDRLIAYREGADLHFTKKPVPWQDLLAGRIDLAELDWDSPDELEPGPRIDLPPKEVLPFP